MSGRHGLFSCVEQDPRPARSGAAGQVGPPTRRGHRGGRRLTERDLLTLAFAAEHRFVLALHVAGLLGTSTDAATSRLGALARSGYLRYERKLAGPGSYQVTRRGLGATGSQLPKPREMDLGTYDHEVGLAWLALSARRGCFGDLHETISERRMRSADGRTEDPDQRLGVRLPGVGPHGGERRHYPDLLLETVSGHQVAVELELTPKGRARTEEILGGYAMAPRIDAVLYLVESPTLRASLERSAARLGISSMVHVQPVRFGARSGAIGEGRIREREAAPRARRAPERGRGPSDRRDDGSRRRSGPSR